MKDFSLTTILNTLSWLFLVEEHILKSDCGKCENCETRILREF